MRSGKSKKRPDYSSLRSDDTVRVNFEKEIESSYDQSTPLSTSASATLNYLRAAIHSAAEKTLPARNATPIHKRNVSKCTRDLYEKRQQRFNQMTDNEIKLINKNITKSCREDYREYIDKMIGERDGRSRTGGNQQALERGSAV